MDSARYFLGRKKYARPQAMLWADNPGRFHVINEGQENEETFYLPYGFEIGTDSFYVTEPEFADQFLILSDDNRSPLDFKTERIEKRERMINGRMRSYHIADKLEISTSWDMLPSRAYASNPNFDATEGKSPLSGRRGNSSGPDQEYTTDGGAGGVEMLNWYESHPGSFWVYLSYDKHSAFGTGDDAYLNLNKYSHVVEVFFSSFSHSVVKRGARNHDFWNVSVSLEEV